MNEKLQDLKPRTKAFALQVIRMYSDLPKNDTVVQVLGKQHQSASFGSAGHFALVAEQKSNPLSAGRLWVQVPPGAPIFNSYQGAVAKVCGPISWLHLSRKQDRHRRGRSITDAFRHPSL
jgi:hypothetical protein